MNCVIKVIRHLLFSTNLNKNPGELVKNLMKTKRIYIKMLEFKIKQDEHI